MWIIGFGFQDRNVFDRVGFPIVVPALLLLMLLNNGVRPVTAVLTAAGASLAIWLLFAKLLMVPLPLGILTEVIY